MQKVEHMTSWRRSHDGTSWLESDGRQAWLTGTAGTANDADVSAVRSPGRCLRRRLRLALSTKLAIAQWVR